MARSSLLELEAGEVPALAARQFKRLEQVLPALVQQLDRLGIRLLGTVARGSSDHAAAFAGYLVGLRLGLPTASLPPSLASVYGCALRLEAALVLAISQSGASPDVCAAVACAKAGGAFTIGMLNETDSALGREVDVEIAIGAGPERGVAATKSFILSLTAIAHLVGAWTHGSTLLAALKELPAALEECGEVDWGVAAELLATSSGAFIVGRGPSLPIAREIALKLKEVCGIHAEAVSAAELLHGPIAIASATLPVIVLAGDEPSQATVNAAIARLRAAGAPIVLLATSGAEAVDGAETVVIPRAPDALLQPIVTAHAAYPFLAALARDRGRNPDHPPQLRKVTRTL
jgi:glucosamine--fructose-6-phosphate aminotransferase (isomerizing)